MAVVIPMTAPAQQPDRAPAHAEPQTARLLEGWHPEQLWLSDECRNQIVQQRMAEAVASAINRVIKAMDTVVPQHELLTLFRYTRREAAALRLTARILRGPRAQATGIGRDLAATALCLAAMRHNDLLAAVEFTAEVTGRAAALVSGSEEHDLRLPPGMISVGRLASRMRRRGREVLAQRLSWPDLDTVGRCLEQALAEDPLRTPSGLFDWGRL